MQGVWGQENPSLPVEIGLMGPEVYHDMVAVILSGQSWRGGVFETRSKDEWFPGNSTFISADF